MTTSVMNQNIEQTAKLQKTAFTCYLLIVLLMMAFGIVYMTAPKIMPYHVDIVGTEWEQIPPGFQLMFLGFMKGAGMGFLSTALLLGTILIIPFRRGEKWANTALFAVSVIFFGLMLALTLFLKFKTGTSPPYFVNLIGLGLCTSGFFISYANSGKSARA